MLNKSDVSMAEWCRLFRENYPIPYRTLEQAEDAANRLKAEQVVYDDSLDAFGARYYVFAPK